MRNHAASQPALPGVLEDASARTAATLNDLSLSEDELAKTLLALTDPAGLDRAWSMAHAYAQGETLDAIGQVHGLTRERVRQLINNETRVTPGVLRRVRREAENAERDRLRRLLGAWSEENPGVPVDVAASLFHIEADLALVLLGRRRRMHTLPEPREQGRATDDDLLDALREFYAETAQTTSAAYSRWARHNDRPGHQTVAIRFGRWNLAMRAAGLTEAEPVRRHSLFTDEDLWAAFIEATRSGPDAPQTGAAMDQWLSARPDMPSHALIRNRLDLQFNELRRRTFEILSTGRYTDDPWIQDVLTPRDWAEMRPCDDDPLKHIRDAMADLGPALSSNRYVVWAKENQRPSTLTLSRRSRMGWSEMVVAAGGAGNHARRTAYTEEQLKQALQAFLADTDKPTLAEYEEWRHRRGGPSWMTISARYGGWREAVVAARRSD